MDPYLARLGLEDGPWLDPATAAVIVLISVIAAFMFHKAIFPLIIRATQWTPTDLDSRMLRGARWPLNLGLLVLGGYLATIIPFDLTEAQRDAADKTGGLLGIVLGIFAGVAMVSTALDWYLENLAHRTQQVVDVRLFPLLRRTAVAVIYGVGALLILDLLDITISPLIAGLGLGGLAVALAIQPTLANLFAGTYVMTEGVVSPGDYIELEGDVSGYVVEVSWRSTRIRTWRNNLVVVPNSRFAETIITNYTRPAPAVNVQVSCGVSYASDLDRVEEVSREVMGQVLDESTDAVREYGNFFGFDSFGDSNVNFWLFLQARDRWGAFNLQTALMEKLHRRFKEEGIIINYPMRTLEFPEGWGPESLGSVNGGVRPGKRSGRNGRRRVRGRRPPPELDAPQSTAQQIGSAPEAEPAGEGPELV
ncbi:MAG: hypothetical protein BZY88_05745 [SAR202 cluster bacterium Io17-Chloro-G9]|nr:MAG: hypothetical protein BZY88_05745 [SAR202 cluster bacterium Io17-Chloro-G9]